MKFGVLTAVVFKIFVLLNATIHSLIHRYRCFLQTRCASIFRVEFPTLKKERVTPPAKKRKPVNLSAEFHGAASHNTKILKTAVFLSQGSFLHLTQSRYICEPYLQLSLSAMWYAVGSKSFRPDIQKPRQMENSVRDI